MKTIKTKVEFGNVEIAINKLENLKRVLGDKFKNDDKLQKLREMCYDYVCDYSEDGKLLGRGEFHSEEFIKEKYEFIFNKKISE